MIEFRSGEHRPIQTSAVIVLGASKGPSLPPPSPPTPFANPTADGCEPLEAFDLEETYKSSKEKESVSRKRLQDGLHVLNTEAAALHNLGVLYETDPIAREGFTKSVAAIIQQASAGGKLVVIGVGKSGHIGKKLVATFQSLSVRAVFLHPTEALHGDLGIVGPDDTLMFITYSGSTQELMLLLPHLDDKLPTILLTSHTRPTNCKFIEQRPNTILLPAPVHELEKDSFGVSAPTTSTTVALAVGDALAIAAANELHPSTAKTFAKNHPGGAIGAAARAPSTIGQLSTPWQDIHDPAGLTMASTGLDLLRSGFDSKSGWVIVDDTWVASPTAIRNLSNCQLQQKMTDLSPLLLVSREQMFDLSSEMTIRQAKIVLRETLETQHCRVEEDDMFLRSNSVIAVIANGTISGVLEVQQILDYES
ncbi:hypothetical protein VHEMI00388 [[Torrubiella] hemipterigena]|uniref:SIS domain-containing protein n=1 Tax=[Torrubiella] hemipterigena TaxID=1531966 RepID=A0A0A1T1U7_9HYPO|nr:hypothetical protein VHEMI00388 [[Torrubiella] hemipterigena]